MASGEGRPKIFWWDPIRLRLPSRPVCARMVSTETLPCGPRRRKATREPSAERHGLSGSPPSPVARTVTRSFSWRTTWLCSTATRRDPSRLRSGGMALLTAAVESFKGRITVSIPHRSQPSSPGPASYRTSTNGKQAKKGDTCLPSGRKNGTYSSGSHGTLIRRENIKGASFFIRLAPGALGEGVDGAVAIDVVEAGLVRLVG
jgi:hypothetical protein